jgi:hypothetical protein
MRTATQTSELSKRANSNNPESAITATTGSPRSRAAIVGKKTMNRIVAVARAGPGNQGFTIGAGTDQR